MKVIGYDVGTTGFKAALYDVQTDEIRMLASEVEHYPLHVLPNGGAEQDAEDWWRAMCRTTHRLLEKTATPKTDVVGISCCSQCCTLVMVDEKGRALRPAMSIMDTRASEQYQREFQSGLKIAGYNAAKLIKYLQITGAGPISAKDTIYRYLWVRENEPDIFGRTYKWLDTKEYLNFRATGHAVASRDDAYMTFLYDVRQQRWSEELCKLAGIDPEHLPGICDSTAIVGNLLPQAAEELGLTTDTVVISGGTDVSLCQVGSGALLPKDVNICSGTSGWVCTNATKMTVDISHSVGSIVGADPEIFLYTADCETAGKCMEWCKERLSSTPIQKFSQMIEMIHGVPAGSNGVIFSPWMHGNRCPFEDANARGMFFNIDVDNQSGDLMKAVVEGVCFHMRWLLEVSELKIETNPVLRFSGGSAMSAEICQIMADCLGREIETIESPRQAGTMGAAAVAAVGLGVTKDIKDIKEMVRVGARYEPNEDNHKVYDHIFPVFKELYKNNKKAYAMLNGEMKLN